MEYDVLQMAIAYCENCISLADCVLPMKGYIPVPPYPDDIEMYGDNAPYSWRKCSQLLNAESSRQQEAAMAGKWQERNLSSFISTKDNEVAYNKCVEYAKALSPKTSKGILLFGVPGTGKTHLAIGILKQSIQRGLGGMQVKVPDLLEQIRKGYDDKNTKEKKAKETFLLVLDDLGTEKVTDWVLEKLFSIIDYRYENQFPTIITSNCSPAELTERIGDRIADRLREMCDIVKIEGKSWRGRV